MEVAMRIRQLSFWLLLIIPLTLSITSLSAKNTSYPYVPVLCYHRINPKISSIYDLTPENLAAHLQFFRDNGYHPITAIQYIQSQEHPQNLPDKPVILTFDDGNKDHYLYVFPLLRQFGYKATFFVNPGPILEKNKYAMSWDELLEMSQAGMDIESHTFSHPFLTKTNTRPDDPHYLQWLEHELRDAKMTLEQQLHTKVELLAYPFGWFNCIIEAKAVEAGYQGIFSVNWGVNQTTENPLRIKRRAVSHDLSLLEMERYLTSKPLSIEIISPNDAAILYEKPLVQFKLNDPSISRIDIIIGNYKGELAPDSQDIFTFTKFETPYFGYYMIIVSGYDHQGNLYINSWGFDYQKPENPIQ
jgi:peptidoglycan/xylan/chitin deacetylase (PgdA/CDA1 family)